jgi:hypothetical protein
LLLLSVLSWLVCLEISSIVSGAGVMMVLPACLPACLPALG